MTLAGAPDYQNQAASTLTPLGSFAVNTSTSQSFNVTAGILPYHDALQIYWVASLASAGEGVQVGVNASIGSVAFLPSTIIPDGLMTICSMPGRYITDNAGNVLTVTAAVPSGGASPLQGTLIVFAVSDLAVTQIKTSATLIGIGANAALGVGAGGSGVLLAPPIAGTYYRIKSLAMLGAAAAPGAGSALVINATSSGVALLASRTTGSANQVDREPFDLEWSDGLTVVSNATTGWSFYVAYEVWNG